jgi:chromosomal replication initiation ATPase DnaA
MLQRPTHTDAIAAVANVYLVQENTIIQPQQGRQHRNIPCKVAMYICQRACVLSLKAIAEVFRVTREKGEKGSRRKRVSH